MIIIFDYLPLSPSLLSTVFKYAYMCAWRASVESWDLKSRTKLLRSFRLGTLSILFHWGEFWKCSFGRFGVQLFALVHGWKGNCSQTSFPTTLPWTRPLQCKYGSRASLDAYIFEQEKNSHLHWDHLVVKNAGPSMLDRRCTCVDVSSSAHPPKYPAMPQGTKILESAVLMDLKPSTISCNSRMLSEARRFQKLPGFSWDKWAVGRIYRRSCCGAMPILVTSMYKLYWSSFFFISFHFLTWRGRRC